MRKIILLITAIGTMTLANAQTNTELKEGRISTKGHAEREVTPDIIYLSVSLREYYEDGNLKKKVSIEELEKQFYNAAMKNGVTKENFTIQNIYSYNYQDKKKKDSELLKARQYRLKITDLSKLNAIFADVDPKGMQSTSISGYDHSQKKQIEKELKTEAVKDARANAEILAAAENQSAGKAIAINDNTSFSWNEIMPVARNYSIAMAKTADAVGGEDAGLEIDVKPIKLTSDIDVIFELK